MCIVKTVLGMGLIMGVLGCEDEGGGGPATKTEARASDTPADEPDFGETNTGPSAAVLSTDRPSVLFHPVQDEGFTTEDDTDGWHELVIPDVPPDIVGATPPEASETVLVDENDPALEGGVVSSPYKIGEENRTKVKDTTKWPYSTVVKINTYWTQTLNQYKAYQCTGTLIAEDAVLTAAHCLFNTVEQLGYPYSVEVAPGVYLNDNGDEVTPFGAVYGSRARVPKSYQRKEADKTGRIPYDYGIIKLKSRVTATGTRDLGIMPSPIGQVATMLAYQSDIADGKTMTRSTDKVRKVFDDNGTFNHYIDCEDRASGAAITGAGDWQNVIFGIHSSSRKTLSSGNKYNTGVLITEDVLDDIESWSE